MGITNTRKVVQTAAATFELALGLLAVTLSAFAAPTVIDQSNVDPNPSVLVAAFLLVGLPLFVIWIAARTRLRWLTVLSAVCAVLAVVLGSIAAVNLRPTRSNPQVGIWSDVWIPALAALIWILILIATSIERRYRGQSHDQARGRTLAIGIAGPFSLITVGIVVLAMVGTDVLIRFNSRTTEAASASPERASTLSGATDWATELPAGAESVPTKAGLAVPIAADRTGPAGVVMLDPSTGKTRWRYQIRGVESPPDLAVTDTGRAVVVSFDNADLAIELSSPTFTLDAETGKIRDFWPNRGSVMGTDPPVLFHHVAQDTNSVIAITPAGKKLWTYNLSAAPTRAVCAALPP